MNALALQASLPFAVRGGAQSGMISYFINKATTAGCFDPVSKQKTVRTNFFFIKRCEVFRQIALVRRWKTASGSCVKFMAKGNGSIVWARGEVLRWSSTPIR